MKATLLLAGFLAALAPEDGLGARAAAVKPSEKELTWQRIPWVLDLPEARKAAKEEHRPILFWATGDDPLERC